MSSFRRIYPDVGTKKVLLDGGLNNKFEKSIIQDEESPDVLNCVFENGSVGTRGGTSKVNTAAAATAVFDALYTRIDKSGAESMVAWVNGTMFTLNSTSFVTVPSAQSVWTAGFRVGADHAENYLFMGNGGSIPEKWNGTEFTRHGVYPPTATATAASQAVGVLTGDYLWKYTYVNSGSVESDVSPAMATFTGAAATARVTIGTATVSFGINSRKLYRTVAGGTAYKLVATIANNTATTYDDNIADASLGAAAPTDQGVPPNYNIIAFHPGLGRLFLNDPTNENYIWYTEANNPYVVKASNFDRFGNKSSDIVKGFKVLENSLVVFGNRGATIWYFSDNTPANWTKTPVRSNYGCLSPYGIEYWDNGILYPATENGKFVGFAHLVGDTNKPDATLLTISSMGSDLVSEKIETDIFSVQSAYVPNISSISYKNKIYISVTYGANNTTNNRIFVFDHSYSRIRSGQPFSWCPWTGLNAAQFTVFGGTLYYGSSTATGFAYSMNTTSYGDDGTAINSYFFTKDFFGFANEANFYKDFRTLQMLVDKAGSYYMDVVTRVDSDTGVGTTQRVLLTPGTNLWGTLVWGSDFWGSGQYQGDISLDLGTLQGKRIQFKFSNQNTLNQRFKVHYMGFTYNVKGLR